MSAEVVKVEWEGNLIQALNRVAKIPMAKIIRNAARDVVRGMKAATPVARKPPELGVLYDRPVRAKSTPLNAALARAKKRLRQVMGGKTGKSKFGPKARMQALARVAKLQEAVRVPVDRKNAKVVRYVPWRKTPSRYMLKLTWARGWSKASWYGVMSDLGMQDELPGVGKLPQRVRTIGYGHEAGGELDPAWNLSDDIEITHRPGAVQRMYATGWQKAVWNMTKRLNKALKESWQQ